MKSKFMRSLLAVLGIGALLIALVAVNPTTTTAANLSGGTYTYLINGEEVTFMFDPVVRKEGLLLPTEVFQTFGIAIDGATTKTPSVSKDGLIGKMTLGSNQIDLGGRLVTLVTAPLRLNGRLFLPADLLKEFGIDFVQDGTMIVMRPLVEKMPPAETMTPAEWNALKSLRGFTANIKADTNVYMTTDFTLLNEKMINTTNIGISYGIRAKLNAMLQTNTLMLVRVSNYSGKAGAMQTAGTFLVDDLRTQYDVTQVMDIGQGLLTAKVAPGADRWGVLVFPKVPDSVVSLALYYDAHASVLGNLPWGK